MFIRLSACFVLCAGALLAQSELATLSGTVTDSSGAVLPKVAVTTVNEATNIASSTLTNEGGRYVIPSLRPGTYTVTAVLSGFKKYVHTSVILAVNETTRLDIDLAVGETSDQITVTAEAPLLEAESYNRGAVIDTKKIVELPLNGRDYNQLATLSPGVLLPTPRLQSIGFK